jgi:hypothetical protein
MTNPNPPRNAVDKTQIHEGPRDGRQILMEGPRTGKCVRPTVGTTREKDEAWLSSGIGTCTDKSREWVLGVYV